MPLPNDICFVVTEVVTSNFNFLPKILVRVLIRLHDQMPNVTHYLDKTRRNNKTWEIQNGRLAYLKCLTSKLTNITNTDHLDFSIWRHLVLIKRPNDLAQRSWRCEIIHKKYRPQDAVWQVDSSNVFFDCKFRIEVRYSRVALSSTNRGVDKMFDVGFFGSICESNTLFKLC